MRPVELELDASVPPTTKLIMELVEFCLNFEPKKRPAFSKIMVRLDDPGKIIPRRCAGQGSQIFPIFE